VNFRAIAFSTALGSINMNPSGNIFSPQYPLTLDGPEQPEASTLNLIAQDLLA
jgi:hypothetical protein